MGNVPAKEGRNKSNTFSGGSLSGSLENGTGRSGRRYTTSSIFNGNSGESKKQRKREEKERQTELHYNDLVVRFKDNVDGGYLAPYGTYKGNLDFDTHIVRKLIINRELAPFFTPLPDFSESWSDEELLIIISQLTLHSIETAYSEEEDDMDDHKIHKSHNFYKRQEQKARLKALIARIKDVQKAEDSAFMELKQRAKKGELNVSSDLPSKEFLLKLYRNASECPICFLYYPPFLNTSRCCLQPICTECFVQIKRLNPHPPHEDTSNESESSKIDTLPHTLISEPANCPFCAMPNFGVTYDPPSDYRVGINGISPNLYSSMNTGKKEREASEAKDSAEGDLVRQQRDKRRTSLAADSPHVITTDTIRPDWEQKLTSARNKLARNAATATAIHASNLLIDEPHGESTSRRRSHSEQNNSNRVSSAEAKMIEEALRLSLLDEEERKRKAESEEKKKKPEQTKG